MRLVRIFLMLLCAVSLPALCQTQQDAYPDSRQERELKACGAPEKGVSYNVLSDTSAHPSGTQTADKALVYIFRPHHSLASFQSKVAVDGEWRGVNVSGTYFFLTLEPGLHYFCSEAKSRSLLIFTAEAGETYYIEQQVIFKPHSPVHNLFLLSEADSKSTLALTALSTWSLSTGKVE